MSKETMVLMMRMDDAGAGAGPHNTLERHLDARRLPKLLEDGWVMVSATPPDSDGNARITLEREKSATTSREGKDR